MKALTPYLSYFNIMVIILAIALIASILMQSRGGSLGSVFGGSGTVFKTRRGIEKLLYGATIFFGAAFALACFVTWMIPVK